MAKKRFGNPDKIPDPLLIALISQFLSNHGFNSSLRIFNTERRKRPKKHQIITDTYGEKYTQGIPQLDEIFRMFMTKQNAKKLAKPGAESKTKSASPSSANSKSESSSDSSEEETDASSDIESTNLTSANGAKPTTPTKSSSPSSSDSDDVSDNSAVGGIPEPNAHSTKKSLKRKASSSSSDSSSSSSSSSESESDSSEEQIPPAKRAKIEDSLHNTSDNNGDNKSESSSSSSSSSESENQPVKRTTGRAEAVTNSRSTNSDSTSSSESDSSSSASSSDEHEAEAEQETPKDDTAATTLVEASSDTSVTITGDVNPVQSSVAIGKKHIGARPSKLAELSANARDGEYISNDYVSYNYADRAYNDLSVTRGKGFTKEKNKKKRGSYRGGAIDTSGGKGFKFED